MQTPYASLAQSARSQELKKARTILWIVGVLTIVVQGFFLANAKSELDSAFEKELSSVGQSLSEIRLAPEAQRAEFDKIYADALGKMRLIYGGGIVVGLIFVVCAIFVERKPVACTVTGLVLYLGSMAAQFAIEPSTIWHGIIIKVLIIAGLISSVKAALAVEKERRTGIA